MESRAAPADEATQEAPQPRQGFGELGQVDTAPAAEPESDAASAGEIRAMPALEPAGEDPA